MDREPMRWFISDTHFFHNNIIKLGAGRPFSSIEDMNKSLVENFNSLVQPGDSWYHLGDVAISSKEDNIIGLLEQLNGQGHLIQGNHDRKDVTKWRGWAEVKDLKEISFVLPDGSKKLVVMCHFPLLTWHSSGRGSLHLHGHCHGKINYLNTDVPRLDVGVDSHNFYPWSEKEIIDLMLSKASYTPPDYK